MRYWNARSVHGDDDAGAVRGLSLGVYEYDAVNAAVSPLAARFGREHGAGPGRAYGGAGPAGGGAPLTARAVGGPHGRAPNLLLC